MNLHFINTGKAFPYAYYLAVLSALNTQRADIIMWLYDEPGGAYWELIKPRVEVRKAEFPKFRVLEGKDSHFRMAHMVDWCRWKVLYEYGGMFMDMDTLSLKDMSDLLGNKEVVAPLRVKDWDATAFPLNNAFVACVSNSPIIGSILRFVEGKMSEKDMSWGDTGPLIFNTIIREHLDKVKVLPQQVCEPYRGGELLYDKIEISPETRMIHLCGASNKAFEGINEQFIDTSNVLYARLARGLFIKEELHPFGDFEKWLAAKGPHYRPLFDYLSTHPCRTIVEIGTYDGENALWMIRMASLMVHESDISYLGFDLFEDMDEKTRQKELSHADSPRLADVEAKLRRTKAKIGLVQGLTKGVLAIESNPDVVFIDGGHSLETIAHDWGKVSEAMGDNTAVFFDDYFPDRTDMGCKTLIDSLPDAKVFPKVDIYPKSTGDLKVQLAMVKKGKRWESAQDSEATFWRAPSNMSYGQVKQQGYVDMLGLGEYGRCARYDLKGKSILDIGGGPCSLLLRCHNYGKVTVLDPCEFETWVYERYKSAKINIVKTSAEDWIPDGFYDEVWCYNVLQHVRDPQKIIDMMKRTAKKIRVFEWIDTPIDTGHPWSFTTEQLDKMFGQKGTGRNINEQDFLYQFLHTTEARAYYGVFDYTAPRLEHYRFHFPGLVHLPISEKYMGCAFTQKIVKLSKMLLSLGHEVYLYGCEGSDAPCTEFIQTHSLADIRKEWGDGFDDPLGYDWRKGNFRHDFNTKRTETTLRFYQRCIEEINKRKRPDDSLLLSQGQYHKPIADKVNLWLTCEPGVGYRGSYARFKSFESAYLMNFTYGSKHPGESINGDYYDRVIPNYFDPKDFPFCEEKGDYYLFIGRIIQRKGVWTAIEATRTIGAKLFIAGQTDSEIDVTKLPDHCKFVGYLEPDERARLMGHAKAVFVPTQYLEAFGGVNVEAQLCGTPAISTNFGCFPETIKHGVTGFLCNTLQDFVDAARKAPELDPFDIRLHASRYLMDNVKHEYQRWFDDLYQLYRSAHFGEKGWSYLG
jgi:glycosyltransferase involved in cell wall biosynthesis